MRSGSPCVAVVIPAYNASSTIAVAVRSALAQPEAAEVAVIDDGSSDDTAAVARACDDGSGRLHVWRQRNAGVSSACNTGVAATTAPVWTILDSDDAFADARLGVLLDRVGQDWELAADPVLFRFTSGEQHRLAPSAALETVTLEAFVRGNIPRRKTPRAELGYLQPLKKRAFFAALGLRFDPAVRFAEDYMFYARALAAGARFLWADGPGYIANVLPGSLSHTQESADYARVIAFDEALLQGRTPQEARALREHVAAMRLKAEYLEIERRLDTGRTWSGWRRSIADPSVAAFVFNNRYRPRLSRHIKRLLRLDPEREFFPPSRARAVPAD